MWLNLYGRQAVRHKLKKVVKTQKMHFYPFFEFTFDSLMTTKVEPHQCPLHPIYPTHPRTNPWNFCKKILRIGGAPIWPFFGFWLLGIQKKNCCCFPMKISMPFIWGIIYFCTMDSFLRIFGKGFIRTHMHTTVNLVLVSRQLMIVL